MKKFAVYSATLGAAVAMLCASAIPAQAGPDPKDTTAEMEAALVLPPVPLELRQYAEDVSIALEGNPNYSAVELNDERTGISIHWFGDTHAISDLLAEAPAGYTVTVEATVHPAGDLQKEVDRLLAEGSVVAAGVDVDASKIIAVAPSSPSSPSARADLTSISPYEIEFEQGTPVPASRNQDTLGIGGARISFPGGSQCSTAFAVQKGATKGIITAAHCGSAGQKVTNNSKAYGTTSNRIPNHDAMLITGRSGGYQGGFYQNDNPSSPNADSYQMPVFGTMNPIVNDEICYSGAFRGLTCGHIVHLGGYKWTLAGVGEIQGFRTVQSLNKRYVGEGDSGGPGVVLVKAPGGVGVMPYAATITSAMQDAVAGTCEAGTAADNNKCSHIILATGIRAASQAMGYSVILN